MKIEQIYTGCLAQGAYYIESNGEVAIIDPLRETNQYIEKAEKNNAQIKWVLETHFHADFVSGHVDLANKTGATIVYGPNAETQYHSHIAADGEFLPLGEIFFKVIHTPGHTMESTCYLLLDKDKKPVCLFSGDTLFIGDVGRPDLAQKHTEGITTEFLAATLYQSLHNKILTLPDDIIIYPAHGAGSACGKNMSKETSDTLANQKKHNYALQAHLTQEEFIKQLLQGLPAPPAYFPINVMMNKDGVESIDDVINRGNRALTANEFEAEANETGALILDTRKADDFKKGFIPNSIFIGIDGGFAPWVGTLINNVKQPILLITDVGREEEVITRLARVGYDHCIGYLQGGFATWAAANKEVDTIDTITAHELAEKIKQGDTKIVDVRNQGEYDAGHLKNVIHNCLSKVNVGMDLLQKDETCYVHCAGGYRSVIYNSILRARGYDKLVDVAGGYKSIVESEAIPTII